LPVGNDVVDLRAPHVQPAALHPRFDLRVFGDEERELLATTPDVKARHRLRWAMWAAKESALKHLRQFDPRLPFLPRQFAVRLDSSTRGRIVHRGTELDVALDVTPARVHAVTVGPPGGDEPSADPGTRTRVARVRPRADASTEVRRLAVREIGRLLRIRTATLEIDGAARSAPRARRDGELLPVDLSLSHDGSWLACAIVPRAAAPGDGSQKLR
jgi:phosphopantetheinyl transferase (holo-ACP synthase)